MTDLNELNKEITRLTNKLKDEKPNVYKLLMENPKTIPNTMDDSLKNDLVEYKNHLKELLTK